MCLSNVDADEVGFRAKGVVPRDHSHRRFQQVRTAKLWTPQRYSYDMEPNRTPDSGGVNAEPAHGAAPWWLLGSTVVAIAAVSALTYGGPVTGATLVVWIVFAVLFVCLVAIGIALGWQRYMRLRRRRASALSLIVLIGMIVAWVVLANVLQRLTTPATVMSYTAQFVSAAIIFGAGMTALARMDARATQPPG